MDNMLERAINTFEKEIEFDYECGSAYVIREHVPLVRFVLYVLKEKREIDRLIHDHYGECSALEFVTIFFECLEKETNENVTSCRILTNKDKEDYETWKRERTLLERRNQ